MSPGLPPGPLEENRLPFTIGVVVGLLATLELDGYGWGTRSLRGIGFGLLVALVSASNLPSGIVFGAVVYLLVRG